MILHMGFKYMHLNESEISLQFLKHKIQRKKFIFYRKTYFKGLEILIH
jgi:hypothetical protein